MIKSNKHIEIVRSTARGLSSMSHESAEAVRVVLTKHYAMVRLSVVNNLPDLQAVVGRRPGLVFLGMEFIPANPALGAQDPHKIWITEYLETHGLCYTGSSQAAHEFERNKPLAKQRVRDARLQTAAFCVIKRNQAFAASDMPLAFPVFIKPTNRGGGLGIDSNSVAHTFEQLQAKVQDLAAQFQADALVEEYLPGREFSVAILKQEHSAAFSVMPIELVAPPDEKGARLLSRGVKSSNAEQAIAITDDGLKTRVSTLARQAFGALGARDYGRIDIRLDACGVPHFLEANLIPSLISGYGSFPKACLLNLGMEYEAMILQIVRLGLARNLDTAIDVQQVRSPQTVVFA